MQVQPLQNNQEILQTEETTPDDIISKELGVHHWFKEAKGTIQNVKFYNGCNVSTDHRLVEGKLSAYVCDDNIFRRADLNEVDHGRGLGLMSASSL
mgnify:CR=1 FL=1